MRVIFAAAVVLALTGNAAAQNETLPPSLPRTGGVGTLTQGADASLTAEQKGAIARAVKQLNRQVRVPEGLSAQVGAELPPVLELYALPDTVLAEIPAAKLYKYTVIEDRVILVDPTNMRVVDILED